ncbi:hypothetical protein SDC9_83943 [bioreactor metagenome]|uniref:DUF2953 domain-containing protein n=1 Tax=bioreactor metagenome TaxID=1076179 RepID=A0A644ZF48_9ZZZZ
MYILTILILFLILVLVTILIIGLILLQLVPIRAFFNYDIEEPTNFQLIIRWMNSFFKSTIIKKNGATKISIYLFNIKIMAKNANHESKGLLNKLNFLRTLNPSFLKINASYGFVDPSITGMIFGAAELVCNHMQVLELSNNADFNTDYDYGKIYAIGTFKAIPTLKKLINYKRQSSLSPVLQGAK